jgi:diadenosine tetraphosphate (Ap4A) HIT family hydrolase
LLKIQNNIKLMSFTLRIFGLIVFFSVSMLFGTVAEQTNENLQNLGGSMDYDRLKIKSYKHWDLYLHDNQCYLGRVFVLLKETESAEDFLAIEGEVRDEFFFIGQEVKVALNTLFKPDKMNYAALSNTSPAIHVHIVPRYKEAREFAGTVFKDTRWGQNYAPYDRSFVLQESILLEIRDALKGNL